MHETAKAAFAAVLLLWSQEAAPPAPMTVSQWAENEREVPPESGSPYPGRWSNERVPYLVEPMDVCGLDHPSRRVVLMASAQSAKSEASLNAIAAAICTNPVPILVMLPSLDEAIKYNRVKLQPAIDATPALKRRVLDTVSRDEQGSTTLYKRFRGGFLQVVNAGSSKALQMISACLRVYEEPTGYPADVDGRGDPISQADARSKAWKERGEKSVLVGTPGTKGACRITAAYEASDMRRFYVPCPHCSHYQVLRPVNLLHASDRAPHGAYFVCVAGGCVIEGAEKTGMVARGAWIRTFASDRDDNPAPGESFAPNELEHWRDRPADGREPGFAWWQAYSPFVSWDDTKAEELAAQGDPRRLKVLYQQAYGEAWEEIGEAPDHERLLDRRQPWPANRLPAGVLFLVGATDVQGNRLEWAVYGWDRHLAGFLIARGVIEGDPATDGPWQAHDQVMARRFQDAWGRTWPVDVWGVDSGYLSQRVYRYVHLHAASGRVRALDGRPGWRLPAIGTPKTVDVDWEGRKLGAVQLWPVGTWDLKSELYAKLRLTIQGPDEAGQWPAACMWFGQDCDREYFEQLTAEFLDDVEKRSGHVEKVWVPIKGRRNEQHDLAVYALGLAHHASDGLTDAEWTALERERLGEPEDAQLDLASAWAPTLRDVAQAAAASPATATATPPAAPPRRAVRSAGIWS